MSKSSIVKVAAILLLTFFSFGCIDPGPLPENVICYTVDVTECGAIEMAAVSSDIDFGGVPAGTTTEKTIGFDGTGAMRIYCVGEIADWTTLVPNEFVLDGHQNVTVRIDVPFDADIGSYESMIVT